MEYTRRGALRLGAALSGAGLLGTGAATAATYSIDTDLTGSANVTGTELDDAIDQVSPGSPLVGLGDTFVQVQAEQGVNAVYQAAHAAWESAWGTSSIAQDKNNLYGWTAYDSCPGSCAATFASFADCVETVIPQIRDLYLDPDGTYYTSDGPTLRGMNRNYATDPDWAEGIASVMNSLADHLYLGDTGYDYDDRVVTTANLSVREGPGLGYSRITVTGTGDAGYVRDGPVSADGYDWYEVAYNAGYQGWSAGAYLDPAPL